MQPRRSTNYFIRRSKEEYTIYTGESSNSARKLSYFLIGAIIFCIGVFLIFQNTIISTNFSLMDLLGFNPPFGLVLLPLIIGVGVLFFNGKSIIGWFLVVFGIITILLGILMGLKIYFKPVTLYQGILMYGMAAAGFGLIVRAFIGKRD